MTTNLALATSMYPLACIEETARAFGDHCKVRILESTASAITIEISTVESSGDAFRLLVADLLNYLLDASVESQLASL